MVPQPHTMMSSTGTVSQPVPWCPPWAQLPPPHTLVSPKGSPTPYLALLHGHGVLLAPLQPHAVEMPLGAVQGPIQALPPLLNLGEGTRRWEHTGEVLGWHGGPLWSPPHPYQLKDAVELGQDALGAVPCPLQLSQRALQGSLLQFGRQRAHPDEAALPPSLPLPRGHLGTCCHRCGVRTVGLDHPAPEHPAGM